MLTVNFAMLANPVILSVAYIKFNEPLLAGRKKFIAVNTHSLIPSDKDLSFFQALRAPQLEGTTQHKGPQHTAQRGQVCSKYE